MEEGMATYIEPIARAQIGRMTHERVWGDFVRDMPQGLPQAGDQGLDRTPTWGRTYWGGAIFWLLADVRIREATHNQKGLAETRCAAFWMRAATSPKTGPWSAWWKWATERPGTTVLADLYQQMKATAVHTDLDDLWRRLGVQVKNGAVTFDDHAPLAEIRKAITRPVAPADSQGAGRQLQFTDAQNAAGSIEDQQAQRNGNGQIHQTRQAANAQPAFNAVARKQNGRAHDGGRGGDFPNALDQIAAIDAADAIARESRTTPRRRTWPPRQ